MTLTTLCACYTDIHIKHLHSNCYISVSHCMNFCILWQLLLTSLTIPTILLYISLLFPILLLSTHPIGKVWIYRLLFVFCVFVWIQITPTRIKLAVSNFAWWFISVEGRESQICVNFALPKPKIGRIGQRAGHAHPHVNTTIEMCRHKLHATDATFVKFKHVCNISCGVWT